MSHLQWRTLFSLGLCAIVTAASSMAHASAPDHYPHGARAAALAGAATASATGHDAVYYNPAGVVGAAGVRLGLGYAYHHQALSVGLGDNGVDDVHGLTGGVAVSGSVAEVPFGFGLSVSLPDDVLSFIHARRRQEPRWELYDARNQLLLLATVVAVKPAPWLSLGGGIGFLSATRGHFGVRGKADILSPFDSQLEHEVDADLTTVRFPLAGIRLRHPRFGRMGITYRGQSKLDLKLRADVAGLVDFAGIEVPLDYDLDAHAISAFTPRQLAVGWALERFWPWSVHLDLTWMNWAAYDSPTAAIAASLKVDVPEGLPVTVPDSPAPTERQPVHFRNTVTVRTGVEYAGLGFGSSQLGPDGRARSVMRLPLRMGYAFEPSPIPPQTGVTSFIDADRHRFSAGLGFEADAPFEVIPGTLGIDVYGAWSLMAPREEFKTSPADFTGDYRAEGFIVSAGADVRLSL